MRSTSLLTFLVTCALVSQAPNVLGQPPQGPTPSALRGTYAWSPTDGILRSSQKQRKIVPQLILVLSGDSRFTYIRRDPNGSAKSNGAFNIEGGDIHFSVQNGEGTDLPLELHITGSILSNTDGSFQRLALATRGKRKPGQNELLNATGRWDVCGKNGSHNKTIWYSFSKNGTWKFHGPGYSSAGTYHVTDNGIELIYLFIDGEAVEKGSHMHKTLPVLDSNQAFQVDTYRYERSTS